MLILYGKKCKLTAMYVALASIRSASLYSNLPRSEASNVLHGDPNLKASLAASTAKSTSALVPCCTSVITLPFAGFIVSNVFPVLDLCHSLFIKIWQ